MPSKWRHNRNYGSFEIDYDFGLPSSERAALSALLNEACHVFQDHPHGQWKTRCKDKYASLVATQIKAHPGLTHRLLRSGERVIQMLTYRALEILERSKDEDAEDA